MLSWLLDHQGIVTEASAIVVGLTIILLVQRRASGWFHAMERGLGRIARRRGLSVTLVGLLALGASVTLSLAGRMPEPRFHDEFSYLLAADTFAHGRLSNPTHPLWVHFESFHIIQQPTYASKYPPGQGLMLAAGQVIGGHPIVGVWISTALACAAIYWMLLAWLPPWWAMLGGLLAALHPGMLLTWGQSYWGGMVAAMGGALVFGAGRRIVRQPHVRYALLLGLGLAVLANSRPYEGLIASLPLAVALLAWMLGKKGPPARVSIGQIVLPIVAVLALTGGAMGFYNLRVTGDALRLPYQVHEATYAVAPILFVWQRPRPEPIYRHAVMRDFWLGWMLERHAVQQSVSGLARESVRKVKYLWIFYQGSRRLRLVLTIPLITLPWVLRDSWARLALLTCGVLTVGLFLETYQASHYAAPITGLVFALGLQAMCHLRVWRWRGRPIGRSVVWTLLVIAVASFTVAFAQGLRVNSSSWEFERARILAQLREDGRRHLVIVQYGPLHSPFQEWVYNEADIDGAKVVWARDMGTTQNGELLEYFKDRCVWLAEVDQDHTPLKLVPYPPASCQCAPHVHQPRRDTAC